MNLSNIAVFLKQNRPKTKRQFILYGTGLFLLAMAFIFLTRDSKETEEVAAPLPVVSVSSVASLNQISNFSTIGVIEAISEAQLKAEVGGQVTSVNTDIGKYVQAGAIIAQLENSAERASLLQAQGSYDAALAGAEQSNSSVRDAQLRVESASTALMTTLRNSFTTTNGVLLNTVDIFFSNPADGIPGLRVSGDASQLNAERVAFRELFSDWRDSLGTLNIENSQKLATDAKSITARLISVVDSLQAVVARDGNTDTLAGKALSTYTTELLAARATLTGVIATIDNAERDIKTAQEGLDRAKFGGTNSDLSLANAQIKIALGSLRAAQSNYEKTLVRTPISGVVNALYVKRGDYVSNLQDVAVVANNDGLQINTSVNDADSSLIKIGDEVIVNNNATGTITAIAGAVDPKTGKVAVKISLNANNDLSNGTTVNVIFKNESSNTESDLSNKLYIPLSAVKLSVNGASVFIVTNENILQAVPVSLGAVLGEDVIVESGIEAMTEIVIDARGRKAGEEVTVDTK